MNLSKFSISELRELEAKVIAQIKKREANEVTQARIQIRTLARKAGISLTKLLREESRPAKLSGTRVNGKVGAKFRNPSDESQQWTGRGRQPKWVKEWTMAGNSLDSLKI